MAVSSRSRIPLARPPELAAAGAPERAPRSGLAAHCAACGWLSHCLPHTLNFLALGQYDALVGRARHLRVSQPLFVAGSAFRTLYALRSGAVMTRLVAEDGREQITGYHIVGDIIGMDGIATAHHACTAVAVDETDVCTIPFDRLTALAQGIPELQRNIYRLLSRELGRHQERLLMLGSMDARERLVAFLLDLSARYRRRGASGCELRLHLSRDELGSYLGLKLETVSRAFSRLQTAGFLQVQGRDVKLLDLPSLRRVLGLDGEPPGN